MLSRKFIPSNITFLKRSTRLRCTLKPQHQYPRQSYLQFSSMSNAQQRTTTTTTPQKPIKVSDPSKVNVAVSPVDVPIRHTKLFINGQFVNGKLGKEFDSVNPMTGEVLAKVSEATSEDVDAAVKAARNAYDKVWKHTSPAERAALMFRLADLMEENIDELASIEARDNGKTFFMARNVDVAGCISTIRYYAGWATKIQGKSIVPEGPYQVYTRHESFGVVGCIIPWNFPLLMKVWKLGPLLACGNTAVVKTSEKTPLAALKLADLINQAGFPPGVVNVLSGFGDTAGMALASHMDVDKIAFTGSTGTGRKIMKAAAESNLKKVTLELGGKSPAIVFPDVDIDAAVEGTHFALFFNHGQVCCAGSRVFVHESIYDEFVEKSVQRAQKLPLSSGSNTGGALGPVVDRIQHQRVSNYIEKGKQEGARLVAGGTKVESKGTFIAPTVFADVTDDMTIAKEEVFGPLMSILKFKTIDEVVERANNTLFGLSASVWTDDINKAQYVANNLKSGTVWINCHHVLQPSIPFGGYKQSGFGRDLGEYALQEYTQVKAVVSKLQSPAELKINMYSR
jgi:aldehyde dehydrogenase (NAD+)